MKSAVYYGPFDIRCAEIKPLEISLGHEILVQVEATSICGSDLHLYRGALDFLMQKGHSSTGHELVGRVVEVGPQVTRFKPGDRITTPYSVSCGYCYMCEAGQTGHCETTNGAIIGFGIPLGDLGGTQAEYILIPYADANAMQVPEDIPAEAALTLSCNLPSAIVGVTEADVQLGDTVAIVGCGPTGLMTMDCAFLRGAGKVVLLDRVPHRLAVAQAKGAVTINIDDEDWKERALAETQGRGFDKVIEVVGMPEALQISLDIVRRGGIISAIGVFCDDSFTISPIYFTTRNIDLRTNGTANVRPSITQALTMLKRGIINPKEYFTHEFALSNVDQAYATFYGKKDGVVKVLIRP
ncbi:alcohol dehydrogenase catalytic domain-containing protein [Acidicapsa ligni]|uniref:alcohol dehydrogenase catalytic domain-containing protein n=1 Tax=Acidicapsa ligni TaxID=542300 RepID=UPI0021DFDAE0|nr:alcohol dehydrogenase catalytic domain-containing protein [Acidicapsa ligni]